MTKLLIGVLLLAGVSTLVKLSHAQALWVSPCPRLFSYEPPKENDRWYGVVTLISETDLKGVWLRVAFDKPSIQLGNWFGEIRTSDNMEYLIHNRNHELKANMPYALRFYIKYTPGETPPQVTAIRLNARPVCPEGQTTTPAAITGGNQLITSAPDGKDPLGGIAQVVSTTPITTTTTQRRGGGQTFSRPGGGWTRPQPSSSEDDDDDVFQGDFQLIGRPHLRPQAEPECGTVVQQPRPLITYGQSTKEGEFPWHVALYHERGADLQYICGASLISRTHVITVAHCVTRRRSATPLNPDSLVVYLGKYYLKKWGNPGIQDSQVAAIIPHPEYNSQSYANDIALLQLANSVTFTDYVRPICLWGDGTDFNTVLDKPGTVVGWGFDHTGKVTEELTQAKMPVVSKETCIYSFPDFFSRFTTSKTYCAGFRNGTSVCNGDSGGGMVFPKATSTPGREVWQLRGLVSISVALQNQFKCDSSHYVVFTDVAKYLDWIHESMRA